MSRWLVYHNPACSKSRGALEILREAGGYQTPEGVIDLPLEHPKLMQRPVVIRGERGLIARPSQKVRELPEE